MHETESLVHGVPRLDGPGAVSTQKVWILLLKGFQIFLSHGCKEKNREENSLVYYRMVK